MEQAFLSTPSSPHLAWDTGSTSEDKRPHDTKGAATTSVSRMSPRLSRLSPVFFGLLEYMGGMGSVGGFTLSFWYFVHIMQIRVLLLSCIFTGADKAENATG